MENELQQEIKIVTSHPRELLLVRKIYFDNTSLYLRVYMKRASI